MHSCVPQASIATCSNSSWLLHKPRLLHTQTRRVYIHKRAECTYTNAQCTYTNAQAVTHHLAVTAGRLASCLSLRSRLKRDGKVSVGQDGQNHADTCKVAALAGPSAVYMEQPRQSALLIVLPCITGSPKLMEWVCETST